MISRYLVFCLGAWAKRLIDPRNPFERLIGGAEGRLQNDTPPSGGIMDFYNET